MKELNKVPLLLKVVLCLFVLLALWSAYDTYVAVKRHNKVLALLSEMKCDVETDHRIICAERFAPESGVCRTNDAAVNLITCKDGRKFELRSLAGGSVAIHQLQ